MEWLIFGAALGAFVGVLVAQARNRSSAEGFALGCLLGPIGWLIEALLPRKPADRTRDGRPLQTCPFCAERILAEAKVCRYCGRDLPEQDDAAEEAAACPECGHPAPSGVLPGFPTRCAECEADYRVASG